jgi:hypothetical protein
MIKLARLGDTIESTTKLPTPQTLRCRLLTPASVTYANTVMRESPGDWHVVRSEPRAAVRQE